MKFLTDSLGLYLHIPFCRKKCRYCDFYSGISEESVVDRYTEALIKNIKQWGGKINRPIDTVYFGGGTPSLLNHRLIKVMDEINHSFFLENNAEITLELNPEGDTSEILENAKKAGINRLSIGVQSGNDEELIALGRTHSFKDAENTVKTARKLGFFNISLDLMIGLPDSDMNSLLKSLEKITELEPEHISAYILKIEPKTVFYSMEENLNLPDDDEVSEQYLFMCSYLEAKGYSHYEISNFAKENRESIHNLKYWLGKDYLGLGPSAHSFLNNERFYYPKDLRGYIAGNEVLKDCGGYGIEEYIMLRLRLKGGIVFEEFKKLFGNEVLEKLIKKSSLFEKAGYININENSINLTDRGMLLSNSIITELLECVE